MLNLLYFLLTLGLAYVLFKVMVWPFKKVTAMLTPAPKQYLKLGREARIKLLLQQNDHLDTIINSSDTDFFRREAINASHYANS